MGHEAKRGVKMKITLRTTLFTERAVHDREDDDNDTKGTTLPIGESWLVTGWTEGKERDIMEYAPANEGIGNGVHERTTNLISLI